MLDMARGRQMLYLGDSLSRFVMYTQASYLNVTRALLETPGCHLPAERSDPACFPPRTTTRSKHPFPPAIRGARVQLRPSRPRRPRARRAWRGRPLP